ncbi:MAG: hypothetical protein ACI4U2_01475 [Christensenellaceae bacterium]
MSYRTYSVTQSTVRDEAIDRRWSYAEQGGGTFRTVRDEAIDRRWSYVEHGGGTFRTVRYEAIDRNDSKKLIFGGKESV